MSQLNDLLASIKDSKTTPNTDAENADIKLGLMKKGINAPAFVGNTIDDSNAYPAGVRPNGGLEGQALQDYINKNPGPVATTGTNLNLAQGPSSLFSDVSGAYAKKTPELTSTDSEDKDEEESSKTADTTKAKIAALQKETAQPTQTKPLFGNDLSDEALKAAQEQGKYTNLIANLGRAGNLIGAGFARTTPNDEIQNALEKQAGQPAADILQRRKAIEEGMGAQLKAFTLSSEQEKADPNSVASKAYRDIVSKMMPDLALPDNASATSLEKVLGPVEKYAGVVLNKQYMQEVKRDALERKAAEKQSQAVGQTNQLLESARGNPAVQQAEKDLYSAAKAKSLINSQYDPNNLSLQQVKLIVSEVSKIATGGVPSVAEMQALTPDVLNTKFANVLSKIKSAPTASNVGEFVKQYDKYLDELQNDARNVMKDKVGRVLETRKDLIGEDNYKTFNQQYLKPYLDAGKNINKSSNDDHDAAADWLKDPKNQASNPALYQAVKAKYDASQGAK